MVQCVKRVDTGCNRVAAGMAALSCALFVLQRFALKDARVLRYAKWTLLVGSPLVVAGGQIWSRMSKQSDDESTGDARPVTDSEETLTLPLKLPSKKPRKKKIRISANDETINNVVLKRLPKELKEDEIYALADECLGKGRVTKETTQEELVEILNELPDKLDTFNRHHDFEKLVKTAVCVAELTFIWLFKKYANEDDPHEHVASYIKEEKGNLLDRSEASPILAYNYVGWPIRDYHMRRTIGSEGFFTEGHENYRAREVYNRYAKKMQFVVERIKDKPLFQGCCPIDNDASQWNLRLTDIPF